MKGKSALMAGVAVVALVMTAQSGLAGKSHSSGMSAPTPAPAAMPSGPSNEELAARVKALEDQLQSDETNTQVDHTRLSTLEQNFNYTSWTFDNARPVVNSGDGRFSMALRVRMQADFADFMQRNPLAPTNTAQYKDLSSGAVIRRAFFGVEGKAFKDFWYEFRYNGGGTNAEGFALSIARIAYVGIPHLRVNLGIIEPAFMNEGTVSSGQLMFLERPEIDNIAATTFGASDARRGVELVYQYENAFMPGDNLMLETAFTGDATGTANGHGNGGDERTHVLGRAAYRFWSDGTSNAQVGVSAASVLNAVAAAPGSSPYWAVQLSDRPEIRVDGTSLIDTGKLNAKHATMYAFDAGVNFNQFYLGGEWANFEVDRKTSSWGYAGHPNFSGWYLEGSWVLTGEPKAYNASGTSNDVANWGAPKVANPFSLEGDSWGAWELTARYSDTNLNWNKYYGSSSAANLVGVNGGEERIIDLGINWYLNQCVKLQINDLIVNVNKITVGAASTPLAPIVASKIGQNMNVIGVRLQFSN